MINTRAYFSNKMRFKFVFGAVPWEKLGERLIFDSFVSLCAALVMKYYLWTPAYAAGQNPDLFQIRHQQQKRELCTAQKLLNSLLK